MVKFNLLEINWFIDKWINIAEIDDAMFSGSLFYIGVMFDGTWQFDMFWYSYIKARLEWLRDHNDCTL